MAAVEGTEDFENELHIGQVKRITVVYIGCFSDMKQLSYRSLIIRWGREPNQVKEEKTAYKISEAAVCTSKSLFLLSTAEIRIKIFLKL